MMSILVTGENMNLFTIISQHCSVKSPLSIVVHKVIQECLKQKTYYKKENIYLAVSMHQGLSVLEQSAYFRQNIGHYEFQKSLVLGRFEAKSVVYLPPETSFELLLAGIGGIQYSSSKTLEWLCESFRKGEMLASLFFGFAITKSQTYVKYQSITDLVLEVAMNKNLRYSHYLKGEISNLPLFEKLAYFQQGVDETNCVLCEIKILHHNVLFHDARFDGVRSKQYLIQLKRRFNQVAKESCMIDYSNVNSFLETIGYLCDVDFFIKKDFQRQINVIKNTPTFFSYYFLFKLYQVGDKNHKKSEIQSKYYLNKMLSFLPLSHIDIVWNDALVEYNRHNYIVAYYMFRAIEALKPSDHGKYYLSQCLIKNKQDDYREMSVAFAMLCYLKESSTDLSVRMSAGEVIKEYSYYLPLPTP
jgi:hypothetical protein